MALSGLSAEDASKVARRVGVIDDLGLDFCMICNRIAVLFI